MSERRKLGAEDYEKVFGALAHPVRRQVLVLLATLGGELPSGYLARRFQHSWPTTTRHLRVLEEAGLVRVERQGRSSLYRLDHPRLTAVIGTWLAHLEPPTPSRKYPRLDPSPPIPADAPEKRRRK